MSFYDDLNDKYLELLSNQYKNRYAAFTEIINLQAILNLPKGTEHFISDIHGEYDAFSHILNNCSGVIRTKVDACLSHLSEEAKKELCTLVYYPQEKLQYFKDQGRLNDEFTREILFNLISLCKYLSSKYTRSKVRKAIAHEFNYIVDELMHAKSDEDDNKVRYHNKIIESILENNSAHHFIISLCQLAKRLAVDHLHIVGDLFDRGDHPDAIIDLLMKHHSIDIQWGNHDILWMGANVGSKICVATAVRNTINYQSCRLLEKGYGISLRKLMDFAHKTYKEEEHISAIKKAISVIIFKLEGQVIKRNKDFKMQDRLLFEKIDFNEGTICIDGKKYNLNTKDFPTVDRSAPYVLSNEEISILDELCDDFKNSKRLSEQVNFLYAYGSMYKCFNGNLIYHGCVPLNEDGSFREFICDGIVLSGKEYLDYCDYIARKAKANPDQKSLDMMWYLWCGKGSPLSGRIVKTLERTFIDDKTTHKEPSDPYYSLYFKEEIINKILKAFSLSTATGHIINGHTPIKVKDGEKPVRAGGKMLVIDGGFSRAYHSKTGIAGYTLIFNSHGLTLKTHKPFTCKEDVIEKDFDILSDAIEVEKFTKRQFVEDTDNGEDIIFNIKMLKELQYSYEEGLIPEKEAD